MSMQMTMLTCGLMLRKQWAILFGRSMVAKISSLLSRGHDTVLARNWENVHYFTGSYQYEVTMEVSMIVIDAPMWYIILMLMN